MNYNNVYTLEQLSSEILKGRVLLVSGAEELLMKLPKGNWVGGTIPYFMTSGGGIMTRDALFATDITDFSKEISVKFYDNETISKIYTEIPSSGFGFLIIPSGSDIHFDFALKAPEFEGFASSSLIGWISGVHLDEIGKSKPKIFNGLSLEISSDMAICLHANLNEKYQCEIGIVNIFKQGGGDTVEFFENGFKCQDVLINGKKQNFSEYITNKKIDIQLPLVANYAGAMVNVSFQNINTENKEVSFYAPVFKGIQYKAAEKLKNYVSDFNANIPENSVSIVFSCNCILNFIYSELEGKTTKNIYGPITFGEIAYQLLNQTMVYLKITNAMSEKN